MSSRFKLFVVSSSASLVVLLLCGAVIGKSASPDEPFRHLGVFSEVLSRIKSDYVEEPEIKNVTLGAVNGMLEALDPFASYLTPDQYKQYVRVKDQRRPDVGLILAKRYGYMGVVDVLPGSSAAKAGLNTNDLVESINGIGTRDMPLAFAEMLLAGDAGSTVEVSVIRTVKPEPTKMTLTRAALQYPAVASRVLPDGVGYVQAVTLETGKAAEIAKALDSLQRQGAKRLVLDLRSNASGPVEEGIAVSKLLLGEKALITYAQGQKSPRQDFTGTGKAAWALPVAVITNRGTAGGAEIVAAAVLDNKRGSVVGEKTFGNASVRKAIALDDGSAVILSVAKYYSPAGKAIQDTGVTPSDAVVEIDATTPDDDDDAGTATTPAAPTQTPIGTVPGRLPGNEGRKPGDDPLLKKAIEVVSKTTA